MKKLTMRATLAAIAVTGATAALAAPGVAQAGPVAARATPGGRAAVAGVGQILLTGPDQEANPVWFGVLAAADLSPNGRFWFRHERPDGTVAGAGWADVTCLQVTGTVALLTAVVPDGMTTDPVHNHAFYLKITDNGAQDDEMTFVQAQNGPTPPPRYCIDPDVAAPGQPRYPVRAGGYSVHAG